MKRTLVAAICAVGMLWGGTALAGARLHNEDSKAYKLLVASSESCFSGTHTSLESNTSTEVAAGWACVNEEKPAVKLEDGKEYIIKNGKIKAK